MSNLVLVVAAEMQPLEWRLFSWRLSSGWGLVVVVGEGEGEAQSLLH